MRISESFVSNDIQREGKTVAFLLMVSSLVESQCIRGMGPEERGFFSRAKVGLLYFEQQA